MKILVVDQGIFAELAESLADGGKNEVVYIPNWTKSHPVFQDNCVGKNFGHLNKQNGLYDEKTGKSWVEWADCIVNPDVFDNDWIQHFKKIYPDKSIFGSGAGEVLEDDRWKLKKIIKEAGLPVQKSYHVVGVETLKKFLQSNPDKYVKINIFRGDCESFYAKDFKSVESKLNKLSVAFGPLENEVEFVCEDIIDTDVEIGFDGFFNGKDYLHECISGYEYQKFFYLARGIKTKNIPDAIKETMTKIRPTLQKMDYRGAISTEEKIVSQKEHYFLDICSRFMNPGGDCYGDWITNLPEVVYRVGKREQVEIKFRDEYMGCILLDAPDAKEEYLYIDVKKEDKDKIKIFCPFQTKDGSYYQVKGCTSTIIITATGKSPKEVIERLKKYSELVNCSSLNKDAIDELDKIHDVISHGRSVGIHTFD